MVHCETFHPHARTSDCQLHGHLFAGDVGHHHTYTHCEYAAAYKIIASFPGSFPPWGGGGEPGNEANKIIQVCGSSPSIV